MKKKGTASVPTVYHNYLTTIPKVYGEETGQVDKTLHCYLSSSD